MNTVIWCHPSLLDLGISGIRHRRHILGNVCYSTFINAFLLLSCFYVFNLFLNFYSNVFLHLWLKVSLTAIMWTSECLSSTPTHMLTSARLPNRRSLATLVSRSNPVSSQSASSTGHPPSCRSSSVRGSWPRSSISATQRTNTAKKLVPCARIR